MCVTCLVVTRGSDRERAQSSPLGDAATTANDICGHRADPIVTQPLLAIPFDDHFHTTYRKFYVNNEIRIFYWKCARNMFL